MNDYVIDCMGTERPYSDIWECLNDALRLSRAHHNILYRTSIFKENKPVMILTVGYITGYLNGDRLINDIIHVGHASFANLPYPALANYIRAAIWDGNFYPTNGTFDTKEVIGVMENMVCKVLNGRLYLTSPEDVMKLEMML